MRRLGLVLLGMALGGSLLARGHDEDARGEGDDGGKHRRRHAEVDEPEPAGRGPAARAPGRREPRSEPRATRPLSRPHREGREDPGSRAASHHRSRGEGKEGREKVRAPGLAHRPERIVERDRLLKTDHRHSVIRLPERGADGRALHHALVGARHWNDPVVTAHMGLLGDRGRLEAVVRWNGSETLRDHDYWHHDPGGFDYCHRLDSWGFHWYGWYVGDRQFWTRYYADRWWFYDEEFDRWCFWNDGYWWWQDPRHGDSLYLYDADRYVLSVTIGLR